MVDAVDSKSTGGNTVRVQVSLSAPMKKVLVIVGPTASGKSTLAVRLARKFKGEIISADSRQVYKGLNIGTGKITKKEMRGIPHYLLDVADPKKPFDASQYKTLAEKASQYIVSNSKLPIVVGGTGFYIDTLTGAINLPEVPPNKLLRKKLEKLDVEKLFAILKKKDLRRARMIDPRNKVRIIRALEIIQALGRVPMLTLSVNKKYKFIFVGISPTKEKLEKNIKKRLKSRLKAGMINEVRKLHTNGLSWKRLHDLGLEYRYIALHLQGKLNKLDMFNKLNKEIRNYSKRQMTWFKRNKKIKWFTPSTVEGFEPNEYKRIEKWVRNEI